MRFGNSKPSSRQPTKVKGAHQDFRRDKFPLQRSLSTELSSLDVVLNLLWDFPAFGNTFRTSLSFLPWESSLRVKNPQMSLAQPPFRGAERLPFTAGDSERAAGQRFGQCFLEGGLLGTTQLFPDSQVLTSELDPKATREWPGSCHRTPRA